MARTDRPTHSRRRSPSRPRPGRPERSSAAWSRCALRPSSGCGASTSTPEDRALLDRNIAEAEAAYKAAGDFETQARALSGWREAILHRLDAVRLPDAIPTRLLVTVSDGEPLGEGTPIRMRPGDYWAQVPARLRDVDRFRVERTIRLRFGVVSRGDPADVEIKVRDRDGVLVWANERPTPAIGGDS